MAVDVKRLIQEMIVPDLQGIKSELATIKVEIKRLDEKIDSGVKRLDEKIDAGSRQINEKIDRINESLGDKIDGVKEETRNLREEFRLAVDIHERLASLEAKIGK